MPRHDNCVHLPVSWVTITQIQVTILATLFHSQKRQPISWVHIVATLFDDEYDEIAYFGNLRSLCLKKFWLIKLWKYVA